MFLNFRMVAVRKESVLIDHLVKNHVLIPVTRSQPDRANRN